MFLQFRAHVGQIRVANPPDLADRNRIDRNDNGCRVAIGNRKCFDVRRIIDRSGRVIRNIDPSDSGSKRCSCISRLLSFFVKGVCCVRCQKYQKQSEAHKDG